MKVTFKYGSVLPFLVFLSCPGTYRRIRVIGGNNKRTQYEGKGQICMADAGTLHVFPGSTVLTV